MSPARVIDVTDWAEVGQDPYEPLGARGSTWLNDPADPTGGTLWIFKPVRRRTARHGGAPPWFEEDWAEHVATRIAGALHVPAADVQLAVRDGWRGVISPNFVPDRARPPTFGNELLCRLDDGYPRDAKGEVPGYTLSRCIEVLNGYQAPFDADPALTSAVDAFAAYLLLDAVVANTDRHHQNWAVLRHGTTSRLAPCYDLGTCLGFQLTDAERQERLTTSDRNRTVDAWAERGTSRAFEGRRKLVDLAVDAHGAASPGAQRFLLDRLAALDDERIADEVADVHGDRLSQWAGTFAVQVIRINRDRLLERLT